MCYFSVDDFVFLKREPPASDVEKHFDQRVRCLLDAVNQLPIMRLLQPLRKGITDVKPQSYDAFALTVSSVKYTDYGHWYVFTTGFREMAQFNIGMYGDYLRVGIGFNIGRNNAGPNVGQNVANSFNRFKNFVQNNPRIFQSLAAQLSHHAVSFGIEYGDLPLLVPDVNFIKDITPDPSNNKFDHSNPQYGSAQWFFVGAILLPNDYTWRCTQNCSQVSSRNSRSEEGASPEGVQVNGGSNSDGIEERKNDIDLLDIVERVLTGLFTCLGNSL